MKANVSKNNSSSHSSNYFFNKTNKGSFFSGSKEVDQSFFRSNSLQPKLTVGQVGDKYEQEADAMAEQLVQHVHVAHPAQSTTLIQHKSAESEEELLQKKEPEGEGPELMRSSNADGSAEMPDKDIQLQSSGPNTHHTGFEHTLHSSKGRGKPLSSRTRAEMEPAFGANFGEVRIHTDDQAIQMSQDIQAQAFTHGSDIYFNQGKYRPQSQEGKRLIAHELTHTIQQGAVSSVQRQGSLHTPSLSIQQFTQRKQIQRAHFNVGPVRVTVDFGGLHQVANATMASEIEGRFMTYTGAADASAIHASLSALAPVHRQWVLYALDLLMDNTRAAHERLNRTAAVQRLIDHAPSAQAYFPSAGQDAAMEALRVSGWLEVAIGAGMIDPSSSDAAEVDQILNPPIPTTGGGSAPFDSVNFRSRMEAGLRFFLNAIDPGNWASTATDHLGTLQTISNELVQEAITFFSPYADSSRSSVSFSNPQLFSVTTHPFAHTSSQNSLRLDYLRNRAGAVGRNTSSNPDFSDTNIFSELHYDGADPTHRAELDRLLVELLREPSIRATVDRLIRTTGRRESGSQIGLPTAYDSSTTSQCEARWNSIRTLCHEILHAFAHNDLRNIQVAEPNILIEGFTEVLSVQLFNQRVRTRAMSDPAFRSRMEAGLQACPPSLPEVASVEYGAYGSGANRILGLSSISDDHFRAAYFLGQLHLIGLSS